MSSVVSYCKIVSNLPVDIQKLIDTYCNATTSYYEDEVKKIAVEYDLGVFGFGCADLFRLSNVRNIYRCINEIPHIFKRMQTFGSRHIVGSYGGKHRVEEYRCKNKSKDCYISNGEFIVAMILSKFNLQHHKNSLNCVFNATTIKQK